ncbi:MAG: AAA family ATPase [Spirochaetales bacterium]|jgi:type II secretory pathway predicted ATPase ExeA|nr:AAA family ATPase [Spirochaetales bacterium]
MKNAIRNHFGFSKLPFGKDIFLDDVFETDTITQATAMLELGLGSEDIMVLTGPIGCGKSLIIRYAAHSFDPNSYQIIYLRGSLINASEVFKLILQGMKVDPPHSILKTKPLFFKAVTEAARKPVVILDDAQDSAPEALLAIKAMTNFDSDSRNRITFILVGQPELTTILGYSHFDSLRARIRLSHQLAGMTLEESCAYIDHHLSSVQRHEQLFSDAAKMEIFKRTGGIARHINTLCYQAIVNGTINDKQIIDTLDLPQDPP